MVGETSTKNNKKIMNVPFWDAKKKYFNHKDEIDNAIKTVLESGNWVLGYGDFIENFEREFSEYVGVKHAVMVGGGTHALIAALGAAGVRHGDEVITVSHTFVATLDAVAAVGGTPVLVDITEDGLIDIDKIEEAITSRTKVLLPVNLEGKVCDMDRLIKLAKKYNLVLIDDSAQAIGSSFGNKKIGSIGDMTCFSFYPAKVLGGIGCGGMVTTNSDDLAHKVRMLRDHYLIGKNPDLEVPTFGYNLEPDCIQAAVLSVKLKYLDEDLAKRRMIAERYDKEFSNLPFKTPLNQPGRVYQDYVIRIAEKKEEFIQYCKENGVGVRGENLIPNHAYKRLGLNSDLPTSEKYLKEQVRIACNPEMSEEDVEHVIKKIKEFYEKSSV